jgi:hypothetical protein
VPDSIFSFGDSQCEGEAEWQREMRAVLLACPDSDQAAVLADGLFSALEGEARMSPIHCAFLGCTLIIGFTIIIVLPQSNIHKALP